MTYDQAKMCDLIKKHCTYLKPSATDPYKTLPSNERPIPGVILFYNDILCKDVELLPDGSMTLWDGNF